MMYGHYSVRYLCALFGKSRQAWYEQSDSLEAEALSGALVLRLVAEVRKELPRTGVAKLQYLLRDAFAGHGIKMGRDALYDLLDAHGMLIRKRRRKPRTTDSNHHYKRYPNLIKGLVLTHAGALWVSDITYLRLTSRFCYLSLVTDAYSHKIVGYKLHPSLHSKGATDALAMAAEGNKSASGTIHHSDRGTQYCCGDYVRMLEHYGMRISMTENGDPYENAIAERVNGILKAEFSLESTFSSFAQAEAATADAIRRYNLLRPHASTDFKTPIEAHQCTGILKKRWKSKAYGANKESGGGR